MTRKNIKKSKAKKQKDVKKRTYNEMIKDNNVLDKKETKDNNENSIEKKNNFFIKTMKNNDENSSDIKAKTDIKFPSNYNFDKTHMPSSELIKSQEETRNLNIPIYIEFKNIFTKTDNDNILKNLHIAEDCFIIQKIYGDGNCLFRCISYFLTGTEAYHGFIRNLLYNYIVNNLGEILAEFPSYRYRRLYPFN